jgi:ribose transport system ATP-binding protein
MTTPLLQFKNITKRFPGVLALDSVGLSVAPGEVVGLIGENGAGKSTLMKILGGIHQADAGSIHIDGRAVTIYRVADAIALGIAFIHQELNVLDNLDVAGNVLLGREPRWGGPLHLIDRRSAREQTRVHLRRLGLEFSPNTPLRQLSLAQQQMVEIAKALSQKARVLIMDEPTSCLTLSETDRLLRTVAELRGQGVSIIYITHRLGEIHRCADRVVALRDGRNTGELTRDQINHDAMVRLMVGRDIKHAAARTGPSGASQACLQVTDFRTRPNPKHAVSFEVCRGEILGFAGLVGAGRSELAQAIFGVDPPISGQLALDEQRLHITHPRDAINAGIYLVPEDRRLTGLLTTMTVRHNISLPGLHQCSTSGLINSRREADMAAAQVKRLGVKTPSIEALAMNLSGGNQQKVVLAKWLALRPKVIIFDEPTRGIDVGAKAEIYRLMRDLADSGVAIVMISSDMEEVLGVSDRIAVMHEGALAGVLSHGQFSEEAVMNLAVGRREAVAV